MSTVGCTALPLTTIKSQWITKYTKARALLHTLRNGLGRGLLNLSRMKTIIFGLTFILAGLIIWLNNDYMTYNSEKCVVLDKLTTNGGYKRSGQFYLVLQTDKNQVFDLSVTPATFSQSKIGDVRTFNVRPFDIKQSPIENALYFFGQVIVFAIGSVCVIFEIIFRLLFL